MDPAGRPPSPMVLIERVAVVWMQPVRDVPTHDVPLGDATRSWFVCTAVLVEPNWNTFIPPTSAGTPSAVRSTVAVVDPASALVRVHASPSTIAVSATSRQSFVAFAAVVDTESTFDAD